MASRKWSDSIDYWLIYLGPQVAAAAVEFIGTFVLLATIGLNVTQPKNTMAPLAIGSVLMVMIFMGGHISGAHFNPAVTVGVRCTGREHISTTKCILYVFLQLLGGFFGALVARGLSNESFAPYPGDGYHDAQAFFAEFLFTFVLVSVMLNTATTKSQMNNSFFGLAIGFTVVAGAFSVGGISGAAFNPAVATAGTVVRALFDKSDFSKLWIYWVSEFFASMFASIVFILTNPAEYREQTAMANLQADTMSNTMSNKGYQPVPTHTNTAIDDLRLRDSGFV